MSLNFSVPVRYGPSMGMGGGSTGTIGPSGEVRLSPPPDPMNWFKVAGCGGPMDVVWWKKGYSGGDMNIMKNYFLKGDTYVSKTPCPIIPMNGMCPKGFVMQSQCPACSVGPGPRCLAPCRISCVPIGTPCPPGAVCDGKPPPIPTPGGPGDYTGTCPKGQHFSHCGCVCRPDGGIEPLCYEFCQSPGHAGKMVSPGHNTDYVSPMGAAGAASGAMPLASIAPGIFEYLKANPILAAAAVVGVAGLAWMMFR